MAGWHATVLPRSENHLLKPSRSRIQFCLFAAPDVSPAQSRIDYQLFKERSKMHLPGTLLHANKCSNFQILQAFPHPTTSVWILQILSYTLRRQQQNGKSDTTASPDKKRITTR
jgi:hypothetical protein